MGVMDKLKKNSKIKETSVLAESEFFTDGDMTPTHVPMINVALSGSIDGGLSPGLTVLAGPSKHFKSSFALLMAGAYLKKNPDAVLLFYDSEFGTPASYFELFDIDKNRVLHTPVKDIEQLKFDMMSQLENIEKEDKVVIVIDSIGNIASKKEKEDAINEKSVADMSRAKSLKSLFRMVTPYLKMQDISCIAVNHTYKEQSLFPKDIVSGGTGIYYSADNIWIIGRQQDKRGTEIKGYHFVINIEKSRYVKEKSRIPITVSWEGGVQAYSGLVDVAIAGGYVTKPSPGWYGYVDQETGEVIGKVRYDATLEKEFWDPIFNKTDFKEFVEKQYSIGHKSIVGMDEIVEVLDEATGE